ncbi:MAG: flagellar basal body-associated FliL family protein [Halocynthiibacter sp.]
MGKVLPALLALIGTGAGIGAGIALRPPPGELAQEAVGENTDQAAAGAAASGSKYETDPATEDVKLSNQFVISVVEEGRVVALVVMSLSVEVVAGSKEMVYSREPKLRDAFLQVLFDHANTGGFQGNFTSGEKMLILRNALYEIARRTLGPVVTDVLIQELVRQDL